MIGYHVTTPKKLARYVASGRIIQPVRFWPNLHTAKRWAKRTGRQVIIELVVDESYPLPDHKPARWTPHDVRDWTVVEL
jgi:hypothetical protein